MLQKSAKELLARMEYQWYEGKLRNAKGKEIGNFFPEVVEYVADMSTGKIICKVKLHIGKWEVFEITLTDSEMKRPDFSRLNPKCIYGIDLPLGEIKRIIQYLFRTQIADVAQNKFLVNRLGWNELPDGRLLYCAGKEIIGISSISDIVIHEDIRQNYNLQTIATDTDIFDVCIKLLKTQCPTITILILVSIVACLRSLFVKAEVIPHFVAYIYGSTGTYKTTIAKYFSRLYGDRNTLNGFFGELESTNAALEQNINHAKDVCVVIDDIAPCQKNKNTKEKKERAASLIRKATSGVKTQKCVGAKVAELSYDVMLIFTAEELLETVSAVNRTVLLNTDNYKITSKILKIIQNNPDFSVLLQKRIIEWAASNPYKIISIILKRFLSYRDSGKCSSGDTSRNRLNETFDILHVAWDLLKKCGEFYGNEQMEVLDGVVSQTAKQVIHDEKLIIRRMEIQNQSMSPLKLLYKIINSGELRMADSKTEFEHLCIVNQEEEVFGVRHKGNLYLMDGRVAKYMEIKYKLSISKRELRKLLEKEGVLIKDKSQSTRKKLCGKSFAVVDYEGLKELCEN